VVEDDVRLKQLLSYWLYRRWRPPIRPKKYTRAWALSGINWLARRRHERACRLANAEDDDLLCLALGGDADATIQLGMSSSLDPRRRSWESWNDRHNPIRTIFLLVCTAMIIYGIGWQAYAIVKWGAVGPP
jgi:hypothetical protein